MRMMLRARMDVEASNRKLADGTLPKLIQGLMDQLKPEAAYFWPDQGKRTCMMIFEMRDPAQIVQYAEPFFQELGAEVEIQPVMVREDLMKGLNSRIQWEKKAA